MAFMAYMMQPRHSPQAFRPRQYTSPPCGWTGRKLDKGHVQYFPKALHFLHLYVSASVWLNYWETSKAHTNPWARTRHQPKATNPRHQQWSSCLHCRTQTPQLAFSLAVETTMKGPIMEGPDKYPKQQPFGRKPKVYVPLTGYFGGPCRGPLFGCFYELAVLFVGVSYKKSPTIWNPY